VFDTKDELYRHSGAGTTPAGYASAAPGAPGPAGW